mgnify:CR=1 FL=1
MNRMLNILIFALISATSWAQVEVGYVYEELPQDLIPSYSLKTHSSLKPQIRLHNSDSSSYLRVTGLADLNYDQKVHGTYKAGLGFEVSSKIKKWHFRLAGVQGLSNFTDPFKPKSFLTQNADSTSFGYTDIRSRISYTPNHIFNFQAGVDHNFLGEGSRSLLLGDYGKPYPFGQIRSRFWRIEYSILYQFLMEGQEGDWDGKFASSHHLSFNAAKWLNIGLFESVVFQPKDTLTNRGFDVEYLNPVIFFRPQEYALGSSDNVIIGLDFSAKWSKHMVYGQFVLDEFSLTELRAKSGWWANKYGAQLGIKGRFGTNNNWFYRAEFNFTRPYTYSHLSEDFNYGNQGTVLAHPYGANFMEALAEVKWQSGKWLGKAFTNYYLTGDDKDGYNQGADIYNPYTTRPDEYGHFIGQGSQRNIFNFIATGSYRFLEAGKMSAFIENHFRYNVQAEQLNYQLVIGIRSMLWNDRRNY